MNFASIKAQALSAVHAAHEHVTTLTATERTQLATTGAVVAVSLAIGPITAGIAVVSYVYGKRAAAAKVQVQV